MVLRDTGVPPWEFGRHVTQARMWEAACILAPAFVTSGHYAAIEAAKPGGGCPLLGG